MSSTSSIVRVRTAPHRSTRRPFEIERIASHRIALLLSRPPSGGAITTCERMPLIADVTDDHEVGGTTIEDVVGNDEHRPPPGLLVPARRIEIRQPHLAAPGALHRRARRLPPRTALDRGLAGSPSATVASQALRSACTLDQARRSARSEANPALTSSRNRRRR